MTPRLQGLLLLAGLLSLAACKGGDDGDTGEVNLGPALTHTPPESLTQGEPLRLSVVAEDADGVASVSVVYRVQGEDYWSNADLVEADGEWSVEIAADEATPPAVEYYFKATDQAALSFVSYLPADLSVEGPFTVSVLATSLGLPFFEDFEVESGENFLSDLGWGSDAQGFPGYVWGLSGTRATSGEVSAYHARGVEDISAMEDWLISPALDLSGQDRVQVTWREYGAYVEGASHKLYASVGSRDPKDGDYVLLAELAAPVEDEWSRAPLVEVSELAGERVVYLAWVYEGSEADDWYIDDVLVRPLTIDLTSELSWAPNPAHPGETTTLSLALLNLADASAESLTVTASLPEGGGVFTADTVTLGDGIAAYGSAIADLELQIDAAWPDNSPMPVTFTVSDGLDSWSFDETFIVGSPTTGSLSVALSGEGLVQVSFGVGDPDAPTWEQDVYSALAPVGALTVEVDLTEQHALLPPSAGPLRWFARIDSAATGRVTDLSFSTGDEVWSASVKPTLILDGETLVYVPEPPAPTLSGARASVTSLSPGVEDVALSFNLRNNGGDFAGPVSISLSSADADVVITDGAALVADAADLEPGEQLAYADVFRFNVSADHVSSLPITVNVDVTDGLESWSLPVELTVPWPVLKVTSVVIDDRIGGDNDGLLEPGETADLELELTNVGDLDTFGVVEGALTVAASSVVAATPQTALETVGSMTVNRTRSADFNLSVDAGASLGEALDLVLTFNDGTATYLADLQLIMGEPPWLSVTPIDDNAGDHYDSTFDLLNVQYRSDGSTLELKFISYTEFDTSKAFVEMWAVPTAADYTYYRLVYQSGSAKLQGYASGAGFVTLLAPTATFPDANTLILSWPLADMGLLTTSFKAGFGAGWCGSETGSYCDHFPDGWGYYYSSYSSSRFFTLSW
ncbi:MAG: choice-of-anchor J domain-containing protein [Deltaproteobacteria bacterium]|nr:choice-of-anchor J domain-containing protein [Deltaproteobacteria bacterium]